MKKESEKAIYLLFEVWLGKGFSKKGLAPVCAVAISEEGIALCGDVVKSINNVINITRKSQNEEEALESIMGIIGW